MALRLSTPADACLWNMPVSVCWKWGGSREEGITHPRDPAAGRRWSARLFSSLHHCNGLYCRCADVRGATHAATARWSQTESEGIYRQFTVQSSASLFFFLPPHGEMIFDNFNFYLKAKIHILTFIYDICLTNTKTTSFSLKVAALLIPLESFICCGNL